MEPGAASVPLLQQVRALGVLVVFAGHARQPLCPGKGWKVNAGQDMQAEEEVLPERGLKVPGGH